MVTLTDRVHSDEDPDPISVEAQLPKRDRKMIIFFEEG